MFGRCLESRWFDSPGSSSEVTKRTCVIRGAKTRLSVEICPVDTHYGLLSSFIPLLVFLAVPLGMYV